MNLPLVYNRYKPAVAPQILVGADTLASMASGPGNEAFVGNFPMQDQTGSPCMNIVIAYNGSAGTDATVAATLWVWEGSTAQWVQLGGALSLAKGAFTKVAIPAVYGDKDKGAGGLPVALITAAATANGTYTFAMGPSAS